MSDSFKQDIIKILIDKLLIGVILIGSGFYVNAALEHYKSQQSFMSELNKVRVEKIGEVWEKLYEYEHANEDLYKKFLVTDISAIDLAGIEEMFNENVRKNSSLHSDVLGVMNKHRFWTGEETYNQILEYCNLIKNTQDERIKIVSVEIREQASVPTTGIVGAISKVTTLMVMEGLNSDAKAQLQDLEEELRHRRQSVLDVRDRLFSEQS